MTVDIARGYELGVGHDSEPSHRLAEFVARVLARLAPAAHPRDSAQASLREEVHLARERARAFDPRLARERAAFDAGGIQQRWTA